MENYLLAYNFCYCVYLRVTNLRDQGVAGMDLLKKSFVPSLASA